MLTRNIIVHELAEVRSLLQRAENYALVCGEDSPLYKRARLLRDLCHDTPDPNNIKRGVESLDELITEMKLKEISGVEQFSKEVALFKKESCVLSNSSDDYFTGMLLEAISHKNSNQQPQTYTDEPSLIGKRLYDNDIQLAAKDLLLNLEANYTIMSTFILQHGENGAPSSRGYDWYNYVCHVNETLVHGSSNFFSRQSNIRRFLIFQAACEFALSQNNRWAAPLIRSLIVAAQELREGGSTGYHGAERLRAKLIVGRLIGELSAFDFEAAITLADSTIESITFSRSQILYQSKNYIFKLNKLIKCTLCE